MASGCSAIPPARSRPSDLTPLFEAFFDTRLGPKLEPASYGALAAAVGLTPGEILFLSDHEGELDAAAAIGVATGCLDRDGLGRSGRHRVHRDFRSVAAKLQTAIQPV
jgi:enolase-phosphatase E1